MDVPSLYVAALMMRRGPLKSTSAHNPQAISRIAPVMVPG